MRWPVAIVRWPVALLLGLVACSGHDPGGAGGAVVGPAAGSVPLSAPGFRLPAGAVPVRYALKLEIDPELESFRGHVDIAVQLTAPSDHVWLHVSDLDVDRSTFSSGNAAGKPLVVAAESKPDQMVGYTFGSVLPVGEVVLHFDYVGHTKRPEVGLFRQSDGTRMYTFSQAESMFARRIVPCFDEPQFKPAWQLTIVAPDGDVAVGNARQVSDTPVANARHEVTFATIEHMPSYLLALAVGPFDVVDAGTMGRGKMQVRAFVQAGAGKRAGVVAAKLPRVVDALERTFDSAVPVGKIDLVAVPTFFGAMENPGLITFVANSMVGDVDDRDLGRRFTKIAAHELAHQWLGNLVTPAWWDDLWLAESFANWLEMKIGIELGAVDDPALRIALDREKALAADASDDAKPLRRKVVSVEDAERSFDAISYEKGTAVVETFESWLGTDALVRTLRAFVREHANRSVTAEDFTAALASSSGDAAAHAFAARLDHTGAPVVELQLRCDGTPRIEAHARDTSVPVCVRSPTERRCELVGDRTSIELTSCPAWVVGNATGVGYYHVQWTGKEPVAPLAMMSPGERLARGDDVGASFARGDRDLRAALAELRSLAASRDVYARLAAISIARAIEPIIDEATAPAWSSWLAARFADRLSTEALWFPSGRRAGSDPPLAPRVLRNSLVELAALPSSSVHDGTQALLHDLANLDTARPGTLELALAIAAPSADRALYDKLVTAALTMHADDNLYDPLVAGIGELGPAFAASTIEAIAKDTLPWDAAERLFERPSTRAAAWRALREHVGDVLRTAGHDDATKVVEAAAGLCDADRRGEVAAAFQPHLVDIPDGRHVLDRVLAGIDRCIARRSRAGDIAHALD